MYGRHFKTYNGVARKKKLPIWIPNPTPILVLEILPTPTSSSPNFSTRSLTVSNSHSNSRLGNSADFDSNSSFDIRIISYQLTLNVGSENFADSDFDPSQNV